MTTTTTSEDVILRQMALHDISEGIGVMLYAMAPCPCCDAIGVPQGCCGYCQDDGSYLAPRAVLEAVGDILACCGLEAAAVHLAKGVQVAHSPRQVR